MLSRTREPLLRVLRESPDFRPAYDPLLRLAMAIAASDADAARELLRELAVIQPARSEAGRALRELGDELITKASPELNARRQHCCDPWHARRQARTVRNTDRGALDEHAVFLEDA